MTQAHLNRIATAVPDHDVHAAFVAFADNLLATHADTRTRALFNRMATRSGIRTRFSVLTPNDTATEFHINAYDFYRDGDFPSTARRMGVYEQFAPILMRRALDRLALTEPERASVTHVIITTCTGLYAPGLDFEAVEHLGLRPDVERTVIGFMGCYAAINGLKTARHIVRSEPQARVLMVNLELCTLHLQETADLEQVLSFLVFADGCAASLISADPTGLALDSFRAVLIPSTRDLITWKIGGLGFDMLLSGQVPGAIGKALESEGTSLLFPQPTNLPLTETSSQPDLTPTTPSSRPEAEGRSGETRSFAATDATPTNTSSRPEAEGRSGATRSSAATEPPKIDLWAVHPGGKSVLDAVERGLHLPQNALNCSREVLDRYGNMSSATVMFVLERLMAEAQPGQTGCAMSFGPGLTAETMLFHTM